MVGKFWFLCPLLFSGTAALAPPCVPTSWNKKTWNTGTSRTLIHVHQEISISRNHAVTPLEAVSVPNDDKGFTKPNSVISDSTSDKHNKNKKSAIERLNESKHVELAPLMIWLSSMSAFVLINNFVGPFPAEFMTHTVPERIWFLCHMLGSMSFGGGVILTTAIEYMVAKTQNASLLKFWFDNVPFLDTAIALPGLTLSLVSGIGLSIQHYGSLTTSPPHIRHVFWTLAVFAAWWALTDLTTQEEAMNAANEDATSVAASKEEHDVPDVVMKRAISNVVSCLLVVLVYAIMVLKPGPLIWTA